MSLQRKVLHDCTKPDLPDPTVQYRWTCPDCGSTYHWLRAPPTSYTVASGFLHMKRREVTDTTGGFWVADKRTFTWREVLSMPVLCEQPYGPDRLTCTENIGHAGPHGQPLRGMTR
jgi:hypothetical protein